MVEALITGFDSAWTPGNAGAIAHCRISGSEHTFIPPVTATFAKALTSIHEHELGTDLQVIGIDQPLIVPNEFGSRPVEGAFRPLLGRVRAAIQPSSRSRTDMFGDNAPIWRFLRDLDADVEYKHATEASSGRFAFEIYPCAALLGLYPEFMARKKAAKYNPGNRKMFSRYDWNRLCELLGETGDDLQIDGFSRWTSEMATKNPLKKSDQDCLDAAICVVIAFRWWQFGYERSLVVGDLSSGYIITPSNPEMTRQIRESAGARGVPVQGMLDDQPRDYPPVAH
jgi:predicted RNase H-like nuclease